MRPDQGAFGINGECELRVRALDPNSRDVLNAMGTYPGDPGNPGGDCAGTLTAVGPGVEHLRPDRDACGIAWGFLQTYGGSKSHADGEKYKIPLPGVVRVAGRHLRRRDRDSCLHKWLGLHAVRH